MTWTAPKEFYERVFEVAPVDEEEGTVIFEFGNLFLRLLSRAEAEKEMVGSGASRRSRLWRGH